MPLKVRSDEGRGLPHSLQNSPLEYIRTLYATFLQGIFSEMPPGEYRWSENEEESEIVIQDEGVLHTQRMGSRPAISLTRGPVQAYSLGMDDMLSYSFRTGAKVKSLLIPGTMSINCSSRVDIVSEALAWYVAESIWMHRELLMRWGFYDIGRGWVVGSPSPPGSIIQGDGADEWVVTTVTSPFQFYRTSLRAPLVGRILEGVTAHLEVDRGHLRPEPPYVPYHPAGVHNPAIRRDETYPLLGGASNRDGLRRIPHPLNPSQTITVVSARQPRGYPPPRLPRGGSTVEQSIQPPPAITVEVKV